VCKRERFKHCHCCYCYLHFVKSNSQIQTWNHHRLSKLKTLKHNSIPFNNQMKSPSTIKTCFNGCDLRDLKEEKKNKK
jgi:hypothetical protein